MAITHTPSATRYMSFQEFLEWADEETWAEWVDGRVEPLSPVDEGHESLSGWLYSLCRIYVETRGLGRVLGATFLIHLPTRPSGREPDMIILKSENLGRIKGGYMEGPADVLAEVVSPESVVRDRETKYSEYEKAGIGEYWLLDPVRKQAEFFLLGDEGLYRLAALDKGIFRSQAIEGLWLKEEWLWQEPLPMVISILREWGLH